MNGSAHLPNGLPNGNVDFPDTTPNGTANGTANGMANGTANGTANASATTAHEISWPLNRPTHRGPWDAATSAANGHTQSAAPANAQPPPAAMLPSPLIRADGPYPVAGIAMRSFALGLSAGLAGLAAGICAFSDSALSSFWQTPAFIAILALFHFLEYAVTATYNPRLARLDAFLLSQNGWAYHAAHLLALAETLLMHAYTGHSSIEALLPKSWVHLSIFLIVVGTSLLLVGQVVRSTAMAQAGPNFNHTVQVQHVRGHELVTSGVYAFLRHPSYFGFFWWGLGTQLLLGNVVSLMGFAVVLWRFFNNRIQREEELLLKFFGNDYARYRARTWVGIPFIH